MNQLMKIRHSFAISRGFRNYFIYSLLFNIIEQLCIVIDMILVGNFVSANAFAALNLVVPLETTVTGLIMLVTGGAGVIASRRVGDHDFEGASASLSVTALSNLVLFLILSVVGIVFLDEIASFLSPNHILANYLKDYLGIYFLSLVPIGLYNLMILLLDVDGKPDIVLCTVVTASILDIVLDVVFMKYMGLGVKGVGLAGLMSYSVPLFFLIPYALGRRCSFRFVLRRKEEAWRDFTEIIATGVPYCLPYFIMCIIVFVVNTLVLSRLGTYALYIWGAGFQILSLIFVAINCICGNILVIMGGMLVGSHDMSGFTYLARKCFKTVSLVVGTIILIVMVFPVRSISLFGYNLPDGSSRAVLWLVSIVLLGIPYTICNIKIYVSQALGRKWISTIPLAIFFLLTVGGLCLSSVLDPRWMFPSLLVSGALFILADFSACFFLRRYLKGVSSYLLIPPQDSLRSLSVSVPYNKNGFDSALPRIESFLGTADIPSSVAYNVNLCCEELMLSIVENNAGKNLGDDWFFDVFILDDTEEVKVTIRDAAAPFNPVRNNSGTAAGAVASDEDMGLSLCLVNGLCKELSYNYMYGQNAIYMTFGKEV